MVNGFLEFGQGVGAALEELAGPDAELWELGVVVTEPGAVPRTGFLQLRNSMNQMKRTSSHTVFFNCSIDSYTL